jgi:hypothetical protein
MTVRSRFAKCGALASTIWLLGCGGECAERPKGTYRTTFTEESGDCGPLPDQVIDYDPARASLPPGCQGTLSQSKDNCSGSASFTCQLDGGLIARFEQEQDNSSDGKSSSGTAQVTILDVTTVVCESSYSYEVTEF